MHFKITSAISSNLDCFKFVSSGNGLNTKTIHALQLAGQFSSLVFIVGVTSTVCILSSGWLAGK